MSNHIKILYFASLREQLKLEDEDLKLPEEVTNIGQLRTLLQQRGDDWANTFADNKRLMMAINQQMVKNDTVITDGDEVAFFPPVTGG